MKMNPILFSVEDNFPMTEAGKHNLQNISEEFGCTIISCKPNIKAQKKLMRVFFEKYGKPTWYVDRLIYTFPLHMLETILGLKDVLIEGTFDTLYMVSVSTLFAYLIGLPLGVLLFTTARGGIHENATVNRVLGWVVNIGRSIPFIILIVALIPFTRLVVGKAIGATAAIVPLVIGSAPFVARLVEQSLEEVDTGVIEAAKCMSQTHHISLNSGVIGIDERVDIIADFFAGQSNS